MSINSVGYGYNQPWFSTRVKEQKVQKAGVQKTQYVSTAGNTCTDGKDDGKIGFLSAVGNIIEGAGKSVVKGIKGMFTDSEGNFSLLKTLGTVAVGALCVACPAVGVGLGAVGFATGAVKMGKGVYRALGAKNDSEAKDMWEQVGEGGITVAASVAGMKASYGAMKTAANNAGGSALQSLSKEGNLLQRGAEFVKAFGKDAYSSTKYNFNTLRNTASSFYKYKKAEQQLKNLKNSYTDANASKIKDNYEGAHSRYYSDSVKGEQIDSVLNDVSNVIDKAKHPFKTIKSLRENASGQVVSEAAKTKLNIFEALSKLSSKGRTIWNALNDGTASYSQLVQKYGYNNVAEVLEVMADYGLVGSQI